MASQRIPVKWALEHLHSSARPSQWTYGCEFELSDWNRAHVLPPGMQLDLQDFTMVNSNGIAVDPTGRHYDRGGEICSRPSTLPAEQAAQLKQLLPWKPVVNYRSNLHVHVRIPGLRSDLSMLKRVLAFNIEWLPQALDIIEPIPQPARAQFPSEEAFQGALRRARRRQASHHHLPTKLAERQLGAKTAREFFIAGVPWQKDGTPMWGVAQRDAVDLKQLLQTDTIEFRHFPGTLSPTQLQASVEWCRDWLQVALGERKGTPLELFQRRYRGRFPQFAPYQHELEVRYRATVFDGTVPLVDIKKHQALILAGKFHAQDISAVSR